jgi:geranylgeranyl diphosphate synthase type II
MQKDIQYLQKTLHESIVQREFGQRPKELYEPIRYLMSLGGKRLRPVLCMLSYGLFKEDSEKIIEPAIGIELFHNFTLMHDDIMDEAPLRRGKATVHEKWNRNIAILSGDVMYVKSYQSMAQVGPHILPKVMERFNATGIEVCEGQQIDMNFEQRDDVSVAEYLEMIRLKTAVLLGFSLELGAIIAEADQKTTAQLRMIGENAGLGFQLKDDLLDVFGDQQKFGKQVGGDIISNKKTYLLLRALDKADANQKLSLTNWLNKPTGNSEEKVAAVIGIYNELGIEEDTLAIMNKYFDKAFELLEKLEISQEKKSDLLDFLSQLIQREN